MQLIDTAHGNTLENLVLNPTLSDLVGGVSVVTLSDEEARRRGTSKTVSERRAPPTFDIVIEMVGRDDIFVHPDTAEAVDRLLLGKPVGGERRQVDASGAVKTEPVEVEPPPRMELAGARERKAPRETRIHPHALSPQLLERAVRELDLDVRIVDRPDDADLILSRSGRATDARVRRAADRRGIPVRRIQHRLVSRYHLAAESVGTEPMRHLVIHPSS